MPCSTAGICGISSCFQLLSPGMRQVIHALLTRPPLSLRTLPTEIVRVRRSVRLACVKHAASVHPEPGSNSLAKYLPQAFACYDIHLTVWVVSVRSCFFFSLIQRIFRNSSIVTFVTCMIVCFAVQLSKFIVCCKVLCCFSCSTELVYNIMSCFCCQHLFLLFSKFFELTFS